MTRLGDYPAPLQAELRAAPAIAVAVVEGDVKLDDVLPWYSGAITELDARPPEPTTGVRAGCTTTRYSRWARCSRWVGVTWSCTGRRSGLRGADACIR